MPCYCRDDRAMRPIYKLFQPNFVYANGDYTVILNEFKLRKFCLFLQE